MPMMQSRRRFLTTLSVVGAAGLVRAPRAWAADGPPETTSVRIAKTPFPVNCVAPQHIAEELLRAEGFTDVRYVVFALANALPDTIGRGEIDFGLEVAWNHVSAIDRGVALRVLSGVHVGCIELFGKEDIRSITDLRGKGVAVPALGSAEHAIITIMAAQVGLDPREDIRWVVDPLGKTKQLFVDGKIDAFLAGSLDAAELHARGFGHVFFNNTLDHPWSQYFCCMLAGNREFVRNYPIATKRVVRAILKAADLCAADPARAAQRQVDGGFIPQSRYDYALQALRELPYNWREYDAEDTVRFYALRLHEAGFIRSSPQRIIADGTDWRFLNELKQELKA